ncbi:hypothetical protein GXP74_31785 [Streptacidiphilus sp. P02-A3a]|nr:hypothetical protein GXP74_31785 [Streptacidiphilus sp. P02-A3a]
MSLLSRLPDVATVYPTVPVDDGYGGVLPGAGAPVAVACRIQPAGAVEHPEAGYVEDVRYQLIAPALPAGPWSRVEWRGEVWAVEGEPQRWPGPRRLAYDVATIKRRG